MAARPMVISSVGWGRTGVPIGPGVEELLTEPVTVDVTVSTERLPPTERVVTNVVTTCEVVEVTVWEVVKVPVCDVVLVPALVVEVVVVVDEGISLRPTL